MPDRGVVAFHGNEKVVFARLKRAPSNISSLAD